MAANLLVLNRWPQLPDRERWDHRLARCSDLISHDRHRVTYLCDRAGASGVPPDAHAVQIVDDFADVGRVTEAVGHLSRRQGPFDLVIAFSEYLLDVAAILRERYDIPGPRPSQVDRFRDKRMMKQVLQQACIRVPRWFSCEDADQTLAAAPALGFPLILKPARGASSQGVRKIADLAELESACRHHSLAEHEIEEFIAGELMHADGVIDRDGRCMFISISRYIAGCLEFESGVALGSVTPIEPPLHAAAERFALAVLSALDLKASAFHLEFFDTGAEFVFLEIGARVAGADVPYVIDDVYGVNLFRLWTDVLLDRPVQRTEGRAPSGSGGWLMIPRPKPLPQRVVSSTSLLGKIPGLYRELVPKCGEVLEEAGGYSTLQGGRFLFRGDTPRTVIDAIRAAQTEYRLVSTPMLHLSATAC